MCPVQPVTYVSGRSQVLREGNFMLRVVIASFLFALGLLRIIQYVTFTKNPEPADGTSLLGGCWNVGAWGTRTFLVLRALSGIGFVAEIEGDQKLKRKLQFG